MLYKRDNKVAFIDYESTISAEKARKEACKIQDCKFKLKYKLLSNRLDKSNKWLSFKSTNKVNNEDESPIYISSDSDGAEECKETSANQKASSSDSNSSSDCYIVE
jgi:hypothetical protein